LKRHGRLAETAKRVSGRDGPKTQTGIETDRTVADLGTERESRDGPKTQTGIETSAMR